MKFGNWVEQNGLSQPEIARILGIPQGTVHRTRNGQAPHAHTCAAIVRATLGQVTLEDLVADEHIAKIRSLEGALVQAARNKSKSLDREDRFGLVTTKAAKGKKTTRKRRKEARRRAATG